MKKLIFTFIFLVPFFSLSAMEIAYNCGPEDGSKSVLMVKTAKAGSFFEYNGTYIDFSGFPLKTSQVEGSREVTEEGTRYFHLNDTQNENLQMMVEINEEIGSSVDLAIITLKGFEISNITEIKCVVSKYIK